MSGNKYNVKRLQDRAIYKALTCKGKEEKRRNENKIVFICSPFAGDIEGNTRRAKRYGRFAVTEKVVPIIPHLMYPQFLEEDDPKERQLGIDMGLTLLGKCQELWVFGNRISSGMKLEMSKAKHWNISIRYFSTDCVERGGEKR